MDITIICLVLLAALLHASWHAIIKDQGDRLVGLAGMNVISVSVVLLFIPFVPIPNAQAWFFICASIPFHIAYKIGLSRLYAQGDLGQVFPIARGAAPILATGLAFGLIAEAPSLTELLAIFLICIGVFLIAREKCSQPLTKSALLIGLFTGLMVASYSVLNGLGARASQNWLSFSVWLLLLEGAFFICFVWWQRQAALFLTMKENAKKITISGLLGTGAYLVFLWALSQGAIGSVAALRETSILFATLIGAIFLRESFTLTRITASLTITIGVVLFGVAK